MDRITCVQIYVNRLLDTLSDPETHRSAAVHLYGVAGYAALLATKRGLSPELAAVCGLLHDLSTYATGDEKNHAGRSAGMARSCLRGSGLFTPEEITAVCNAVCREPTLSTNRPSPSRKLRRIACLNSSARRRYPESPVNSAMTCMAP